MAYKTLLKMWWVRMKTKQRKLPTNEAQRGKKKTRKEEGRQVGGGGREEGRRELSLSLA